MNLKNYIAAVKDFPKKGILFRDITPLLNDKNALKNTIDKMCLFAKENNTTVVCGPEARGFIFGTPVAYSLGVGFVPIRKPGKLPRKSVSHKYELEYGENILSVHHDAFKKGDKVLIVDDLLATGGTILATIKLIESLGANVAGVVCVIELDDLKGREKIKGYNVQSLIHY